MTRKHCEVCNESGRIQDPKGIGKAIYLQDIECPNCNGEGFVGIADNFPMKKSIYDKYTSNNDKSQLKLKEKIKQSVTFDRK